MAEDFWGKIYAELHEKLDFIQLLISDTSEKDLLSWIKPNPALNISCGRFIKKGRISDRKALEKTLSAYAATSQPLRKIILFSWIEKNSETMKIPSLPLDEEVKKQIQDGRFGTPEKIRIMSHIDPREGARGFYQKFIAENFTETIAESCGDTSTDDQTPQCDNQEENRIQELESAMRQLKAENRELRKQLDSRNSEASLVNRKLSEQAELLKQANQESKRLANEMANLGSQLKFANDENIRLSEQVIKTASPGERPDDELNELKQQISSLQKALANREATIVRLESEKTDLCSKLHGFEDQSSQIKNLQKMLAESETGARECQLLAGQLVTKTRNENGKLRWLFVSTGGQPYYLLPEMVDKAQAGIEELCQLKINRSGHAVSLDSLETQYRKIIFGNLIIESDKALLRFEDQMIPVFCEAGESFHEMPVKALWLPELHNRPAGIYGITSLKSASYETDPVKAAGASAIKAFLHLDLFDVSSFERILESEHIDFTIDSERRFVFSEDFRQILNRLRTKGLVKTFCQSCLDQTSDTAMGRKSDSDEICSFCGETSARQENQINPVFSGQKIIIFGGDRAGNDFKVFLEKYGLHVTWYSGFDNLRTSDGSLGNPDLIMVITRQISHTLLREVAAFCEKAKIRLAFSEYRGLTGVLTELKRLLS